MRIHLCHGRSRTGAGVVAHAIRLLPIVAALAVPAVTSAQSAGDPAATRFALAAWPTQKSLPGDVFAITQDIEGYLWLGTSAGLVRFDGIQFQPWAQQIGGLPTGPVPALISASDGALWIGFAGGGGVARLHRGRVVRYLPADGAPPGVNALLEDRRGTIWAATGHGLFRYKGGRWSRLTAADGYDGEQAFSVYEDRLGRVWVGSAGGLYRDDETSLRLVDRAATHVDSLVEDEAGGIWVTDRGAVVRKLGAASPPRLGPGTRLPLPGWRIMRDHHGRLLVASFSGGLFSVSSPTSPAPVLDPVEYEHRLRGSPRALFQDRDANIWVGMRGGLMRLTDNTFQPAGPLDGLNHDGVRTTAVAPDGSIWIATTHALNRFAHGTRQSHAVSQVRALHDDGVGTMWVATDDLVGRWVNGRLVAASIPGVQTSRVTAMATTPGRIWLCTAFRGVLSWSGVLTSHRQPGETARQCLTILADRQERVWAGFTSGGVALHEGGVVRALTERDGLAPGAVLQIIEGSDGVLWFATSGGLSRYQHGRITSITSVNAPVAGVVPTLVEDDQRHIWMGVQSGAAIIRFDPREVDKVAGQPGHRLTYSLYDESDGLQPGAQLWQSGVGGVRDAGGRLWVANGAGMTIIDPRRLRQVQHPSPPRLDVVTVNGERIVPSRSRELPNGAILQIEYAALSLSASSKLRFRHQLEGFDADWVYDAEEKQATYTNLPPANYRFRVSTTHDGRWSEPAVWAFTISPPFYLSRWFLLTAAVVLVGGAVGGTWLRVRAVKARYGLVFAERTRMSREIHDTLLQSLAAMGMELETIASQLGPPAASAQESLRRLRRQVSHTVRDARDTVWGLRHGRIERSGLVEAVREVAEMITATRHVQVEVSVEGRPRRSSSEVELQLLRIGHEAMTNAVRHGQATHIQVILSFQPDTVKLSVSDNGGGFVVDEALTGDAPGEHLGLLGMRERVERVRGQLRITSSPGQGTIIEVSAPTGGA